MFFVYLDNVLLISCSLYEHIWHVRQVLTQLSSLHKRTHGVRYQELLVINLPRGMAKPAAGGHTSTSGLPAGRSMISPGQSPNAIHPTGQLCAILICIAACGPVLVDRTMILGSFISFPGSLILACLGSVLEDMLPSSIPFLVSR